MYTCYAHSYLQLLLLIIIVIIIIIISIFIIITIIIVIVVIIIIIIIIYNIIYTDILLYLFREGISYYQTSPQVCPYVASLECPSPLWADDISIEASLVFLARSIFRHITPSSRSPRNIQFPTSKKYRLFPRHMAHPFLFPQKRKNQSLVGGWATQKLFSSIWIILFKRGKFQDIFKRPLLIKHGLLENSVQYSIDDVSIYGFVWK